MFRPRIVRTVKNESPADFWQISYEIWNLCKKLFPQKEFEFSCEIPQYADTDGCMALKVNGKYIAERYEEEEGFSLHIEEWGELELGHHPQTTFACLFSDQISQSVAAKQFVRYLFEIDLSDAWERIQPPF